MQNDETAQQPPAPHVGPDHQLPPPPPPPHRSHTVRILVWICILALFGLLFWVVLNHKEAVKAPTGRGALMGGPVTITTATATKGDIGVYLNAIGTVTPVYTDTITSQVTGLVTAVHYREGQTVRRGQPLIEIDARPYQAQLLQARGSAGAGHQSAGAGEDGPGAVSDSVGAECHCQTDAGRPGEAGAAIRRDGEERPGNGAVRPGPGFASAT